MLVVFHGFEVSKLQQIWNIGCEMLGKSNVIFHRFMNSK